MDEQWYVTIYTLTKNKKQLLNDFTEGYARHSTLNICIIICDLTSIQPALVRKS